MTVVIRADGRKVHGRKNIACCTMKIRQRDPSLALRMTKREKGHSMLYREDPAGLIVIGQPSHAWVSGQLARAWGNDEVGTVAPWEEVCLAAEQHDLAHALWERSPALNPQTGRPYSFLDMPANMRLALVSS